MKREFINQLATDINGTFLHDLYLKHFSLPGTLCASALTNQSKPFNSKVAQVHPRKCPFTRHSCMSENSITLHKNEHTASGSSLINKSVMETYWCYLNSYFLYEFLRFTGWISANSWLLCCQYQSNQENQTRFASIYLGLGDTYG